MEIELLVQKWVKFAGASRGAHDCIEQLEQPLSKGIGRPAERW